MGKKKVKDYLRVDDIKLKSMDYDNTNMLLRTIALFKNMPVRYLIDDLNDKFGTSFRYNDYLRNRPLPCEIKEECKRLHKTLGKEQEKIIEDCRKRVNTKMFPFFAKVFLVLVFLAIVTTMFK